MSFLQPMIVLIGLPLVALPLIIHLINQLRYQTTRWGAMMFLLAAQRMSRGYAKLRQWLILASRMLAIAGLIFAVGRPLASGLLGLAAGGRADTTIVLLDCSPSMQQRDTGAGVSKLEAGRRQLAESLTTLGSSRWVLIESTNNQPRELPSPGALVDVASAAASGAEADLPAMLETARTYMQNNHTGRTEIWICSDLRENDWHADSGRWRTLRESFTELAQGVRFHLLAYPQVARGNVAVRVTDVRRQQSGERAELLVSLVLSREGDAEGKATIPVTFEIDGARTEVNIEMTRPAIRAEGLPHRLGGQTRAGLGANLHSGRREPSRQRFLFHLRQARCSEIAIIVSDEQLAAFPLKLAASISPDPAFACAAEVLTPEQLAGAAWEKTSLLVWQAPLPHDNAAKLVQAFLDQGGQVLFLPPKAPGSQEFLGVRWGEWANSKDETSVETWRSDQDLLMHTLSGQSLPVGDLKIRRHCKLSGEFTALAALRDGPLLVRAATERGGAYFLATTPATGDSSLAADAVVLYAAVQRADAAAQARPFWAIRAT